MKIMIYILTLLSLMCCSSSNKKSNIHENEVCMDVNILSKLINIPLFVDSCAFTYSPRVSSNDRIPGPSDYELIAILYCSNLENIDNSSKIMQSSKIESLKSKLESASFIKKKRTGY